MLYSQNELINQYLEIAVQNRLKTFDYDGVQFIHLHKFYHFVTKTPTQHSFEHHLDLLIHQYINQPAGVYEYRLFNHRIPLKVHDWVDDIDGEASIQIEF